MADRYLPPRSAALTYYQVAGEPDAVPLLLLVCPAGDLGLVAKQILMYQDGARTMRLPGVDLFFGDNQFKLVARKVPGDEVALSLTCRRGPGDLTDIFHFQWRQPLAEVASWYLRFRHRTHYVLSVGAAGAAPCFDEVYIVKYTWAGPDLGPA